MRKNIFINKLQKLFRTDIRYLLSGTFYLSLGQIGASLLGFALTLGLVRVLDQAEYGQYSYILSLAAIIGIFTLTGMDSAVAQSVARGFDNMVRYGFEQKFKWSIPVSIVAVGIGIYYTFQGNEVLGISLIVAGITTPFFHAASVYSDYFSGKKQFNKSAVDNILRNVGVTGAMLIVGYATHDVLMVVVTFFISNTLISVIRYVVLARKIAQETKQDSQIDHKSASLGKHLSFIEIIANIANHIDKIIVFQLLGATTLAHYALALAPVKQLQGASRIIRTLILPKFSARTEEDVRAGITFKMLIFLGISGAIVLTYWIIAETFFTVFFPEYADARLYSQILSLSLLTMPTILIVQVFSSFHKQKELYILNLIKCITKIALLILLVPTFHILGAVVAYVGMHVVTSVTAILLFVKSNHNQQIL